MPRGPRTFEVGGIYHVVKRATEGRRLFPKTQDAHRFILGLEFCNASEPTDLWSILGGSDSFGSIERGKIGERLQEQRERKRKKEFSITEVLAFVLMPNHIHLILREIQEGGISKYIQKLGGYSTYFNRQYQRVGSLFQSRFKAVPVKDDIQLDVVFTYVHTNPVELWEPGWKEQRVKDPEKAIKKLQEYWASSYNDYLGYSKFPQVISPAFFLDFYGGQTGCQKAVRDWLYFKAGRTDFGPEIID